MNDIHYIEGSDMVFTVSGFVQLRMIALSECTNVHSRVIFEAKNASRISCSILFDDYVFLATTDGNLCVWSLFGCEFREISSFRVVENGCDISAIAFDCKHNRILIATGCSVLSQYTLGGDLVWNSNRLDDRVTALSFDSPKNRIHAATEGSGVKIFDNEDGSYIKDHLLRVNTSDSRIILLTPEAIVLSNGKGELCGGIHLIDCCCPLVRAKASSELGHVYLASTHAEVLIYSLTHGFHLHSIRLPTGTCMIGDICLMADKSIIAITTGSDILLASIKERNCMACCFAQDNVASVMDPQSDRLLLTGTSGNRVVRVSFPIRLLMGKPDQSSMVIAGSDKFACLDSKGYIVSESDLPFAMSNSFCADYFGDFICCTDGTCLALIRGRSGGRLWYLTVDSPVVSTTTRSEFRELNNHDLFTSLCITKDNIVTSRTSGLIHWYVYSEDGRMILVKTVQGLDSSIPEKLIQISPNYVVVLDIQNQVWIINNTSDRLPLENRDNAWDIIPTSTGGFIVCDNNRIYVYGDGSSGRWRLEETIEGDEQGIDILGEHDMEIFLWKMHALIRLKTRILRDWEFMIHTIKVDDLVAYVEKNSRHKRLWRELAMFLVIDRDPSFLQQYKETITKCAKETDDWLLERLLERMQDAGNNFYDLKFFSSLFPSEECSQGDLIDLGLYEETAPPFTEDETTAEWCDYMVSIGKVPLLAIGSIDCSSEILIDHLMSIGDIKSLCLMDDKRIAHYLESVGKPVEAFGVFEHCRSYADLVRLGRIYELYDMLAKVDWNGVDWRLWGLETIPEVWWAIPAVQRLDGADQKQCLQILLGRKKISVFVKKLFAILLEDFDVAEGFYWYMRLQEGLCDGDWSFSFVACHRWIRFCSEGVDDDEKWCMYGLCSLLAGQSHECDFAIAKLRNTSHERVLRVCREGLVKKPDIRGLMTSEYGVDTGVELDGRFGCKRCKRFLRTRSVCPVCHYPN